MIVRTAFLKGIGRFARRAAADSLQRQPDHRHDRNTWPRGWGWRLLRLDRSELPLVRCLSDYRVCHNGAAQRFALEWDNWPLSVTVGKCSRCAGRHLGRSRALRRRFAPQRLDGARGPSSRHGHRRCFYRCWRNRFREGSLYGCGSSIAARWRGREQLRRFDWGHSGRWSGCLDHVRLRCARLGVSHSGFQDHRSDHHQANQEQHR